MSAPSQDPINNVLDMQGSIPISLIKQVGGELLTKRYKQPISQVNLATVQQVIDTVNRNNPQWDDNQVEMYAKTIFKLAPKIFDDPVLVESVLKKIFLYGGIDPSLMRELVALNRQME